MGRGTYSTTSFVDTYGDIKYTRGDISKTAMYASTSIRDTFKQRNINDAMSPYGVDVRESCDSDEHPNSVPIIIGLDETGSMGSIPHSLIREGFPNIMGSIIQKGVKDPQVLFLGIGDHECDNSPLQVSQFESNDDLLDKWLETVYLEGGGGGNYGESYMLSWYFAAKHTRIDSFDKRNQKGFLFTIGDEPVLKTLPDYVIKNLMGTKQNSSYTSIELLELARKMYNVFHIHVRSTGSGRRQSVIDGWSQIMNDDLLVVEDHNDISDIISDTIIKYTNTSGVYGNEVNEVKDNGIKKEIIL